VCSLEFSDLEPSFWQRYRDQGLQVIGIDPGGLYGGDTPQILQQFREQTGVTFPIGWDDNATYSQFRGGGGDSISPFPLDVIIDRGGTIRYVSREYEPAELGAAIESALAQ